MITVKQELERAEERIELVEYRSAERASEIEEGLESYVTKVRAALYARQAWLHLYLVWASMQYSEILRIIIILHVNPFTAKYGQRQVSTKFLNFIFQNCEKQIASCGSTGRELSFEWSHRRISSTGSKKRLESPYNTPSNTLAVKGLIVNSFVTQVLKIEALQQQSQQMMGLDEYLDQSAQAKALLSKFLTMMLAILQIILIICTTLARIVIPFTRTW